MNTRISQSVVVALSLWVFSPDASVLAQPRWLPPLGITTVSVETYHPWYQREVYGKPFDRGSAVSPWTTVHVVGGRIPLSGNLTLSIEVPAAYLNYETRVGRRAEAALGNPYVGVAAKRNEASTITAAIAVRIPVATGRSEAAEVGFATSVPARIEAFAENLAWGLEGAVRRADTLLGVALDLRLGLTALSFASGEFIAVPKYDLQGTYEIARWRFITGVSGVGGLTVSHRAGLAVIAAFSSFQPGVHWHLPVRDERDLFIRHVIGLSLTTSWL